MPSAPTVQTEAPNHPLYFYPLWLERMLGHLTNAVIFIYSLVLFLSHWTVTIVTLGAPYLHYKIYRANDDETRSGENYSEMIKTLGSVWDQYSSLLLHLFPILFPMVSTSGVPLCSAASFTATMTFIVGMTSVGTRIIFKARAKVLHNEHAVNEWRQASERSWRKVPNKSFWILFALPTFIFFLSVGLLISTAMLTFWERPVAGMTPKLETPGCTMKRLQAFKYTFLTVLVTTVTHFVFVVIKLHFLTAFQTAESTSTA